MEVEMQSPPFQNYRSFPSKKRNRSLENSPLSDRPTKRLTVAVDYDYSPTFVEDVGSAGVPSKYPSEDWVKRADGLTLESPIRYSRTATPNSEPVAEMESRMSENVPGTRTAGFTGVGLGILTASLTPSGGYAQEVPGPVGYNMPQQLEFAPLTSYASQTHTCQPTYVNPPFSVPPASGYLPFTQQQPSLPQPGSDMVWPSQPDGDASLAGTISATSTSWAAAQSSTGTKLKPRLTMGPRSDCEKCRLGVKGHWIHF